VVMYQSSEQNQFGIKDGALISGLCALFYD